MNICRYIMPLGTSAVLKRQEDRGSKVKADWIRDPGDFDAASNQVVLLQSDFDC